jgi:voltage-gated potassium channel
VDIRKRLLLLFAAVVSLLVFGTGGYVFLEGWPPLDALYMTVLTVSTVGFREVRDVDASGKAFTMLVIALGMMVVWVGLGTLSHAVIQGEITKPFGRRKVERKIEALSGHYVICGFGRCGRVVCEELARHRLPFIVIEKDPAFAQEVEEAGYLCVRDDATEETTLERAGIRRAAGLVTSVSSDSDNVFIILTAREMNRDLYIIARAIDDRAESKLVRAGANRVVMPYLIGGRRMANAIIRPAVVELLDLAVLDPERNIQMEQLVIPETSPIAGKSLKDSALRTKYGLVVIGIKKPDGDVRFNPAAEEVIAAGDLIIVMGDLGSLETLQGEARLRA